MLVYIQHFIHMEIEAQICNVTCLPFYYSFLSPTVGTSCEIEPAVAKFFHGSISSPVMISLPTSIVREGIYWSAISLGAWQLTSLGSRQVLNACTPVSFLWLFPHL